MPEQFDDSGATPFVADAYRRVQKKFPALPKVAAIRVNPNLQTYGLDGQVAENGSLEINPGITDRKYLERVLIHELTHASKGNEQVATFAEGMAYPDRSRNIPAMEKFLTERTLAVLRKK